MVCYVIFLVILLAPSCLCQICSLNDNYICLGTHLMECTSQSYYPCELLNVPGSICYPGQDPLAACNLTPTCSVEGRFPLTKYNEGLAVKLNSPCSLFYECVPLGDGTFNTLIHSCAPGHEFSVLHNSCVITESAGCTVPYTSTTTPVTVQTTQVSTQPCMTGERRPDLNRCNAYFQCNARGVYAVRFCVEPTAYFDVNKMTCSSFTNCQSRSDPYSTLTPKTTTTQVPTTPCVLNKKYPVMTNCRQYYECSSNNQLILKTCPFNMFYIEQICNRDLTVCRTDNRPIIN